VGFILADVVPVVPAQQVNLRRRFGAGQRQEVDVTAIQLNQDPEAVAGSLRRVREREGLPRRRPADQQRALADFMADRAPPGSLR
jgi:hypothetical protein